MTRIRTLNGALYTLGILGALSFGAVQAFASPSPRQSDGAFCPTNVCNKTCGPGMWDCDESGRCVCI
jgi:hypothetical protein